MIRSSLIYCDGTQISLTSALSVTIPSTGTLGTTSAIPFRLWLELINNGGTPYLGVRNCCDANGIYGFPGSGNLSSTIITSPNSAGVTYTSTAVTSQQFAVIGMVEYDSGMATAGTWNVSPDRIVLYRPGMPLPGMALQYKQFLSTTQFANSSASYADSGLTGGLTLSAKMNAVAASWEGSFQPVISTGNLTGYVALRRGGSIIGAPTKSLSVSGSNLVFMVGADWLDFPGGLSPSYVVSTKSDGTNTVYFMHTDSFGKLSLSEIMT